MSRFWDHSVIRCAEKSRHVGGYGPVSFRGPVRRHWPLREQLHLRSPAHQREARRREDAAGLYAPADQDARQQSQAAICRTPGILAREPGWATVDVRAVFAPMTDQEVDDEGWA